MEAMASGVPCVTTPVNGIPELIQHERTGLLARPGDVDSLAEQLQRLIYEPALRRAIALAARDKVLADFDLERNVVKLGRIFDEFPQDFTSAAGSRGWPRVASPRGAGTAEVRALARRDRSKEAVA
jgi:colanic acid/amylovoran biosynthesis glycosyltransferase